MATQRPNVIVITTDQQRTATLGCYGSPWAGTPNLDALAAGGICCERAYTTNPVCTPARVSLFSGLQVSRHGAWNVGTNAPTDTPMVAQMLADAGYRTHNIGKMHFQAAGSKQSIESWMAWDAASEPYFSGPYYGFQTIELSIGHAMYGLHGHYRAWVKAQVSEEDFKRFEGKATRLSSILFGAEAYDWELPVRLHNSTWTAERAIEFMRTRDQSQPFFLALGFQDPHHPHCVPLDFKQRVDPDEIPLPDFDEGELDDKPPHFGFSNRRELEESEFRGKYPIAGIGPGVDYRQLLEKDIRLARAYDQNMVRIVDQQMGRVLRALDDLGLTENTLVIFTTDHGEMLGDHGLWMKGPFHYEQLVRVPLLMRWPRGFAGGQRTDSIISHLDLVPTILDAAGVAAGVKLDGHDLLPLLRGETISVREGAMIECVDDPQKLRLKTYVTADRKLTWYNGYDFGELYDLAKDPREKVNLWNSPDYAADKARLLSKILENLEPLERRAPRDCYA